MTNVLKINMLMTNILMSNVTKPFNLNNIHIDFLIC